MKYYNVELNANEALFLKMFLWGAGIQYETSGADNLTHFEILTDTSGAAAINRFLETI